MRSVGDMLDYAVVSGDSLLGRLYDVYYDDRFWTARYLVVSEIGRDEATRLISPIAVGDIDDQAREIRLTIDRATLLAAPDFGDIRPVSLEMEANYFNYFGWPHYWRGPYGWGTYWAVPAAPAPEPQPGVGMPPPVPPEEDAYREAGLLDEEDSGGWGGGDLDVETADSESRHHLRSVRETVGYHIEAQDGGIGHVEDFILEPETWRIAYVLVDTSNWWFGKKVAVPAEDFTWVDWETRHIFVEQTREQVKERRELDKDRLPGSDAA